MSVIIDKLTKKYAKQVAVDQLSLEAVPGEILGFLGPNGAGKSTTLKAITGFIEPTSGSVEVCGIEVLKEPVRARSKIGYLPEHNPLYLDMYVHEYLRFIGRIQGLTKPSLLGRISEMIELCGLSKEQNKAIGALSKGYRQRVGLAQALLHDPPVLILDEPTSGLDPNQIKEIRHLIRQVGQNKTLIFSSHVLSEVQALCDRVVIINQGKLVLDENAAELAERMSAGKILVVEFAQAVPETELRSIPGVAGVTEMGPGRYQLRVRAGKDPRTQVFHYATQKHRTLIELREQEGNLEDIFHQLTHP